MVSEHFKKLASMSKKPNSRTEAPKKIAVKKVTEKKKGEEKVLKEAVEESPSTSIERRIEQNTFKSIENPVVLGLSILGTLFPYIAIVLIYGPYGGYLQMEYNTLLMGSSGLLVFSFLFFVIASLMGQTGYALVQRKLIKGSFILTSLICLVMLGLQARDPAYISAASAGIFLFFNRKFARKRILDY